MIVFVYLNTSKQVVIAVDRLLYGGWEREIDTPMVRPVCVACKTVVWFLRWNTQPGREPRIG
jgi:hypothetical protein